MNQIVTTQNLSKRYGSKYCVKDINLSVSEGDIFGFLGPNGAGKSTTLKMILGLMRPTDGNVKVFGKDFEGNRQLILSQTGSLIESPSYYAHLSGLENMRIVQRLRNIPEKNVSEALKIVRLENQKDKKVGQYSLGMKQRLGIAMALLSIPKLLILDEPTNGLDPAGIGEIRELIKSLPKRYGMTVLISSHLLSEIEQIATSVGIINDGNMMFQGNMDELKNKSHPNIMIKTRNNLLAKELLSDKGFSPFYREDSLVFGNLTDEQVIQINRSLTSANIDVLRIEENKKNLESIFLEITGKGRSL
ncbi:ABC transporter ATP-binding protein [Lysinibacillus irui]|uniref:ABC transporter ATP-binding protein n=1 Tax=Lysinibacillus irui TaxID=2998077 RepID=A0ABU5NHY5_9BACI|nr:MULTISPECIES: ABC transporter ATP-binding protein [Lysinibacillus]MEA0553067.1 ABC transporter ATP-binding protein [Lysinibacillus irui]MEA0562683.1 ABC transporter ATP-binding protein [Lysinibacillus irui]MEA0975647.1 ABC transporter ATP-binding protein [Lysinibacillus irui]MEA1041801.1 ABC transporter ATP-binding protein [Lysinibacillus irui]